MVHRYDTSRPVPADLADRIVGNGLRAPSAGFSQGWCFLVLDNPADVARFREAVHPQEHPEDWLAAQVAAPLLIVPHSNKDAYLYRYALPDKGFTHVGCLVARSVLGYRYRLRGPADVADRRGCRAGRVFLRHPGRADRCLPGGVRPAGAIHPDRSDLHRLQRRAAAGPEQPAQAHGRDGPPRPVERAGHPNQHGQRH
jgi:Nitroreductase family